APDIDAAVVSALDGRSDIGAAEHDVEKARTRVQYLANQRLPDVRLEASYRGSGLGGTQFLRTGGFPGVVTGTRSRGLADAAGQVFTNDYPTWSFGATISYPIGRSYEAASHAHGVIERDQAGQRGASLRLAAGGASPSGAPAAGSGAPPNASTPGARGPRSPSSGSTPSSGATPSDSRRRFS